MRYEVNSQFLVKLGANKFMATDSSSGGYPYEVDNLNRARTYPTLEQAMSGASYYDKQPGFARVVQLVAVELEDCTPRIDQLKQYESELTALKQRFGVK